MSSEVAPRYLPPSLDCAPTASPWVSDRLTILQPVSIVERAFHDTAARLVPVQGGGRIVMEVYDAWVEVLVLFDVHNRRSWTSFESGFPLASFTPFFAFANLNQ